jgi:hypothetical protein
MSVANSVGRDRDCGGEEGRVQLIGSRIFLDETRSMESRFLEMIS